MSYLYIGIICSDDSRAYLYVWATMCNSAVDAITRRAVTAFQVRVTECPVVTIVALPVSFTVPRIPCAKPTFRQQLRIMQIVRSRFIVPLSCRFLRVGRGARASPFMIVLSAVGTPSVRR
jgi:hypothetical protein